MAISKQKQDQLIETRKKQIREAALALFDEKGYSATKISDISAKAGISKGLIYHYYETKEDILYSFREPLLECLQECSAQPSGLESLKLAWLRILSYPYYKDYIPPLRIIFTAVIRGELPHQFIDEIVGEDFGRKYFGDIVRRMQKEGDCREGDPEILGEIVWHYIMGCMADMSLKEDKNDFHSNLKEVLSLLK